MPSERKALPPALLGNQRARTHGIYAAKLSPLEDAEVEQLADVVRELCPLDTAALEPAVQIIAGQFWRLQRAYSDLDENGVIRGRKDRGWLTPTFAAAPDLEKALLTGLRELGMTSRRRGIGHDSASKLKKKASPISRTAGEGGRGWVGEPASTKVGPAGARGVAPAQGRHLTSSDGAPSSDENAPRSSPTAAGRRRVSRTASGAYSPTRPPGPRPTQRLPP